MPKKTRQPSQIKPPMPNLWRSDAQVSLSSDDLLDLTGLIYDAAMDPKYWPEFLQKYAAAIGASCANTHARNVDASVFYYMSAANIDDASLLDYTQHWANEDIWMPEGLRLPSGAARTGPMLVSGQELDGSAFYDDFLDPINIRHFCTLVVSNDRSDFAITSAFRPKHKEDFGESELSVARMLWPHLKRALGIRRRIVCQEEKSNSLFETLNNLSVGVVLIDALGVVTMINQTARDILDQRDGLKLSNTGSLCAESVRETEALDALVGSKNGTGIESQKITKNAISISRPSGKRSYEVLVAPVNALNIANRHGSPRLAFFISDPEMETELPAELLQRVYKLTHSEAKLAADFARSASLQASSDTLGITEGTARQYFKAIYHKTDTKGQASLMKLLKGHLRLYRGSESQ